MKISRFVIPLILILAAAGFVGRGMLHRGDYDVAIGTTSDPAAAFTNGRPNLVGAMFYSAWCSACAVLDPKLRSVVPGFEGRAVEFTKFDFSMGQTPELLDKAESIGVENVYLDHKGETGFMALIDRRTQAVIDTISMSDSPESIRAQIESAIRAASLPVAQAGL